MGHSTVLMFSVHLDHSGSDHCLVEGSNAADTFPSTPFVSPPTIEFGTKSLLLCPGELLESLVEILYVRIVVFLHVKVNADQPLDATLECLPLPFW